MPFHKFDREGWLIASTIMAIVNKVEPSDGPLARHVPSIPCSLGSRRARVRQGDLPMAGACNTRPCPMLCVARRSDLSGRGASKLFASAVGANRTRGKDTIGSEPSTRDLVWNLCIFFRRPAFFRHFHRSNLAVGGAGTVPHFD